MSPARIHDTFWEHPSVLAAGNEAVGAYTRMLAYAATYDTDRIVPHPVVAIIAGKRSTVVPSLIASGLAEEKRDGLLVLECRDRHYRDAAEGYATKEQVAARIAFYGGVCWICRDAPMEAMDHVKPLRRGGTNWPANLRPACRSCNSSKGAKWPFAVAA